MADERQDPAGPSPPGSEGETADASDATREYASADRQTHTSSPEPERRIGPYRLVELMGEGGMGEVWLAEQTEPVRRRVALKLIKRGMDTRHVIARFEAERQALALMDHPAIARVFDAGETERGRPFFVMEHVEGVPITEHCDHQRLTTRERLDLFLEVCEGVQHAHHKAVIHRDLKPSNVLVAMQDGKAVPKIIDFGVAKATSRRLTEKSLYTELGVMIGTPEYMSPEQAEITEQDVDTRADVYSLGVTLYELLVGALPFEAKKLRAAGFAEIVRKIREEEPSRPSARLSTLGDASTESAKKRKTELPALRRELSGDLDWITMKALEKDRSRRYGSPAELAADIRRHLNHEPVLASPPSAAYRAKKFVRRHTIGVGVAAFSVLMLTSFAGVMALQANWIARERDRADTEREAAERVSEYLADMIGGLDPQDLGSSLRADLLERARQASQVAGGSDRDADAALANFESLLFAINSTDAALHLIDEKILARAGRTIETELEQDPLIAARLEHTIGRTYRELGLYENAEPHALRAVDLREKQLGREHPDTLASLTSLAALYWSQGRYEDAEPLYVETLETRKQVLGVDHPHTLKSMNSLVYLYHRQGRLSEAEPLILATVDAHERVLGAEHPETLLCKLSLAVLYQKQGRYAEAEPLYLETLKTQRRVLGADHPHTLGSLSNLANLYQTRGRHAEAEPLIVETVETNKRVRGTDHPNTLLAMSSLAHLYYFQGRLAEAEPLLVDVLQTQKRVLGADHPLTLQTMSSLTILFHYQGRLAEAERSYIEILETQKRVLGADHPFTLHSRNSLAILYQRADRMAEAERLYLENLESQRRVLGADHPDTLVTIRNLVELYTSQGRTEKARPLVAELLAGRKSRAEASDEAEAANSYARTALTCEPSDQRDPDSALTFALAANEKTSFENVDYLDTLALAYFRTGNTEKAIETQQKALSLVPADYEENRADLEQRLAEFEKALAGGG